MTTDVATLTDRELGDALAVALGWEYGQCPEAVSREGFWLVQEALNGREYGVFIFTYSSVSPSDVTVIKTQPHDAKNHNIPRAVCEAAYQALRREQDG